MDLFEWLCGELFFAILPFVVAKVKAVDHFLNLEPKLVIWFGEGKGCPCTTHFAQVAHVVIRENKLFPFVLWNILQSFM